MATKQFKSRTALFILFLMTCLVADSDAFIFRATETSRGEYEQGKYTRQNNGEFEYRFEVDEEIGEVKLTETKRLKDSSLYDEPAIYKIYDVYGSGLEKLLTSIITNPKKRNQKIIYFAGSDGYDGVELFALGEDFFEYAKAARGKVYLSSGTVLRPTGTEES